MSRHIQSRTTMMIQFHTARHWNQSIRWQIFASMPDWKDNYNDDPVLYCASYKSISTLANFCIDVTFKVELQRWWSSSTLCVTKITKSDYTWNIWIPFQNSNGIHDFNFTVSMRGGQFPTKRLQKFEPRNFSRVPGKTLRPLVFQPQPQNRIDK